MSELDEVRSELKLRTQHVARGMTPQDQADYRFWSAHDEQGHACGYAVCTVCAGWWETWYQGRAEARRERQDAIIASLAP